MQCCDRLGRMQLKTSLLVANIVFEGIEWEKAYLSLVFFKGQADGTRHIMLLILDFWLEVV